MTTSRNIIRSIQDYLETYVSFADPGHSFAAALWVIGTYLWPDFDAFPYLIITSHTKRSGKSRLMELLSFVCCNPQVGAGLTAAMIFRQIKDTNPTIFIDEAETLSSESQDLMGAVLNAGYRKGTTVPRMTVQGIEHFPVYCPKVFILIGDVKDTLRDRAIILTMQRAEAPTRFVYGTAKAEGAALGTLVKELADEQRAAIVALYTKHAPLAFVTDRDEEIWMPLLCICEVMAAHQATQLHRVIVDMATLKTADARRYVDLRGAEENAQDREYAERLVHDMLTACDKDPVLWTADALRKLKAIPTAPWRKFRGDGLTAIDMGNLLSRFGIAPKVIREPGSSGRQGTGKVSRGYRRADLAKAAKNL